MLQPRHRIFIVGFFGQTQIEKKPYPAHNLGKIRLLHRAALRILADLARQIGAHHRAAPEHNALAAALLPNGQIILQGKHISIGNHRYRHRIADFAHPNPVRRRLVALHFGARMHRQRRSAALGNGQRIFQRQRFIFKTQAHFGAERDVFGQRRAQGFHNMVNALRLFEQHRPALMLVYRGRGAAEIQIDFIGTEAHRFERIGRHIFRIAAQKLHRARHTGKSAVALRDFRHIFQPGRARMHGVCDAHKFAHTFVKPADAREQIAHHVIHQALHGRQNQLHRNDRPSENGSLNIKAVLYRCIGWVTLSFSTPSWPAMKTVLFALMLMAAFAAGMYTERFLAQDACLDQGGASHHGICRTDPPQP